MNRFNKIFHNKPPKLFWFASNFVRYATPKWFVKRKLGKIIAEINNRPDLDYIMDRVNYYCKLEDGCTLSPNSKPLAEHKFGKKVRTAYFFDSYEYTRWFNDKLHWEMIPGDVTTIPDYPAIIKSRPIAGDNANSVVLNLDKFRHFVFLRDNIPFTNKEDKAIFRGTINCHHPNHHIRKRFMQMYFKSDICDAGISNRHHTLPPEWTMPHISMYDHLKYRYIITVEGNDVATNLKWVMSTNSVAVMPRPTYETWYMEGRLIPDYHYIEIKPDYSNLKERMEYFSAHPEKAEQIIRNAHEYIAQFSDKHREKLISLLVLNKYFSCTGQL